MSDGQSGGSRYLVRERRRIGVWEVIDLADPDEPVVFSGIAEDCDAWVSEHLPDSREGQNAMSAEGDTTLLRDAWWSLRRGAEALEARPGVDDVNARPAVAEMRQTMVRIHRALERRI